MIELTEAEKERLREWARSDDVYAGNWDESLFEAVADALTDRVEKLELRNSDLEEGADVYDEIVVKLTNEKAELLTQVKRWKNFLLTFFIGIVGGAVLTTVVLAVSYLVLWILP